MEILLFYNMKRLLIIDVVKLKQEFGEPFPRYCNALGRSISMRDIFQANMAIYRTRTHFRCVKNRWEQTSEDECIPNFLLKDYILNFSKYFTTEEVIESLL